MENVTLRLNEDLVRRSREYAETHGKSLDELIEQLLKSKIENGQKTTAESIIEHARRTAKPVGYKWNREDAYER